MSARDDDQLALPFDLGAPARPRPAPQRARAPRAAEPDAEPEIALDLDRIPDVRDGLTRVERVILYCLQQCEAERRGRMVSTAMLYGRVVEHVDVSVPEFQRIMQRLVGIR